MKRLRQWILHIPTVTFSVLYCFFVIAHDRRRILHFNVTKHSNSLWISQQMREAFPYKHSMNYLIFDRDAKFGCDVLSALDNFRFARDMREVLAG